MNEIRVTRFLFGGMIVGLGWIIMHSLTVLETNTKDPVQLASSQTVLFTAVAALATVATALIMAWQTTESSFRERERARKFELMETLKDIVMRTVHIGEIANALKEVVLQGYSVDDVLSAYR